MNARGILVLSSAVLIHALANAAWSSPPPAVQDPILEIHANSLTDYLQDNPTGVQDVRPLVIQRGVNLDGSLRAGPTFPFALAGNPYESVWGGHSSPEIVLATGAPRINDIDIALPAPGFSWVIGRNFSSRQVDDQSAAHTSDGYQGKNWFQTSQPEILLYEHPTDDEEDVLYLVYGADRFVEFKRVEIQEGTSDTFKATNGAAGVFVYTAEAGNDPDLYELMDPQGTTYTFFGFSGFNTGSDADADDAAGQLWKITDADGHVAFVGSTTDGDTAISDGYVEGRITYAYDTADRRFTYTYTELDGVDRLTEVKAETKTGGTWASPSGVSTVAEVDYEYYTDEMYGDPGALKLVELTIPQTDSGISVTKKKVYRYWEDAWNASTNPGHPYDLKLVVDFEGTRKFDWQDSDFDEDFLTASHETLEPYASAYFEYDSSYRVVEAFFNGECGCGGGATGTHNYEYESNGSYTDNSGYDTTWATRTIVELPSGSYVTQYFDEAAQPLSKAFTDGDPDGSPNRWVTYVVRGSDGLITDLHTPANITGYTHSTGAITTSTSAGLVRTFTRAGSGAETGYVTDKKWKEGTSGSAYLDGSVTWDADNITRGDTDLYDVDVASTRSYVDRITSGTSGSVLRSYTISRHTSDISRKQLDTSHPAVSTSKNGSGSANTKSAYFEKDGRNTFSKSEDGSIAYKEFTNGQVTKLIVDADTTKNGAGEDFNGVTIPTGFSSSGSPLHQVTEYAYDAQGRPDETTLPSGRVLKTYYSRLADHREVVLSYTSYESGTPTFTGPVQYTVRNHAGKAEVQASVALTSNQTTSALTAHIDETDDDPITAADLGTVARLTTTLWTNTGGTMAESRLYHSIPASGAGSDGTNYDPTLYGYDDMGRQTRVKEASGTIYRTAYDAVGRVWRKWVGTNDSSFSGGEASGTDDMVKTEELVYDAGGDDGNSLLTKRTLYVEDGTTDKRETTYTHDVRGEVLVVESPESPHQFNRYDNLMRRNATGLFSSTASIVAGTDDPTTETTNRIGLSQTYFDEMGRVWKSVRHKIDDTDGSDDDTLESLTWYDEEGKVIKVDGSQLAKTTYDSLGRATHRFILANTNDTVYADADDVTGDIVLEEHRTTYEADTGHVIMQAVIARYHDDYAAGETTGALDSNADGDDLQYTAANVTGRIQISSMWYDSLERLQDRVEYGTNGGSDFDRDGLTVPTRSDTALRTTYTYDTDGTRQKIEDPRGLFTYFEYDDAGRKTKEVHNYDASVNSGNPSGTDDNQTVVYAYTDGLMISLTADIPAGGTDQVTTYTYGTTKGATAGDSNIGTGHLLQKVQYPDSAGGSDVVTYAYNAQGELLYKKDQAGNIIETNFDDVGREEHRRVTTLDADFDGAVKRISTTYTDLGQVELVTQYDNATVGSGSVVDEVKFTWEDWANVSKFEQDRNSAVGAVSSVDDYEVSYEYGKATSGRNTIRRAAVTLPSGNVLTYSYDSSTFHDGEVSRVTQIKDGEVSLARYSYNGVGQVVGNLYGEPDAQWLLYGSTSGDYPDLDRFNRVTNSKWTKGGGVNVEFYDIDITYDRNSNITLIEDNVHSGFDVDYTMDELDRLAQAEEGTWSGSAITSKTREQNWTLDHLGNWDHAQLDLDGNGNYTGTDEYDDDRTHNDVNELTAQDLDNDSTDDATLTYDEVGNLTDDGQDYKYVYDAFGRMRKVLDRSDDSLVAEYTYNGLGFRIGEHADTDDDGDVDGDDKWYYFAYDERWRQVATFREDDSDPKEEFVPHQAGLDGSGRSSYIDLVVCRYKDANTAWTAASDGVLEQRYYYCQNWRADVSAIVDSSGQMIEWAKYSSYGVPFGLPGGDSDSDGDCDSTDITQVQTWIDAPIYDVRADVDLDGDVDASDKSALQASYEGSSTGHGALSSVANGYGQAGLITASDGQLGILFARMRAHSCKLGRWLSRDPLGYEGGNSLYVSLFSNPLSYVDPTGAIWIPVVVPTPVFVPTSGGGVRVVYEPTIRLVWWPPAPPPTPPTLDDCLSCLVDCNPDIADIWNDLKDNWKFEWDSSISGGGQASANPQGGDETKDLPLEGGGILKINPGVGSGKTMVHEMYHGWQFDYVHKPDGLTKGEANQQENIADDNNEPNEFAVPAYEACPQCHDICDAASNAAEANGEG